MSWNAGDALPWVAVPAGIALAVVTVVDVFLTIVHPDLEGALAKRIQVATWHSALWVSRRWRSHRRGLLALAGPVMTALTFIAWISLFIVAVALLVWPFLGSYRAEPDLGQLGFLDALYYAGTAVTVLGYGDITPHGGPSKILAFVASGVGLALFTAIVTYLVEVVSGIDERNRFALRVHDEMGGDKLGSTLAMRSIGREELEDLRQRYDEWASMLRTVQDRLHRYAHASLFYRSKDRVYDPVPAVRMAAEAAMAGYLLAAHERWRRLEPAVEHLDLAVTRLLGTLADQYLGPKAFHAVEAPEPTEDDRRYLRAVDDGLCRGLGDVYGSTDGDERALRLAFRCRHTLSRLDRLLHWTEEEGAMCPWAERGEAAGQERALPR